MSNETDPLVTGSATADQTGQFVEVKNHTFSVYNFKQPTFCGICGSLLWGLCQQGQKCQLCDLAVHRSCAKDVTFYCHGTTLPQEFEAHNHNFNVKNYYCPTFCSHCGSLLWGLFKQGVKCSDCGKNVHHRCQDKSPKTCGGALSKKDK